LNNPNPLGVDHVYGPDQLGGPLEPWIVRGAIAHIDEHLAALGGGGVVFEYGCGSGTPWFVDRSAVTYSIETCPAWGAKVCEYLHSTRRVTGYIMLANEGSNMPPLIHCMGPSEGFDVVLVDGRRRVECIEHASGAFRGGSVTPELCRVKPGGLLVLDNAERDRYAKAVAAVDALGWDRTDHKTPDPRHASSQYGEICTAVWKRPRKEGE